MQKAQLSSETIRDLLGAARSLPSERVVGDPDLAGEDVTPRALAVDGVQWDVWEPNDAIASYEDAVLAAFIAADPATWTPDRWFERPYDGACRVVDTPTLDYAYVAPVYPHVVVDYPSGGCGQNSSGGEPSPDCSEVEFTGYDETGSMHTVVPAAQPLDVTIVPSAPEACTTGSLDVTVTVRNNGDTPAQVEPRLILSGGVNKYTLTDWPAFDLAAGRTETLTATVVLPPVPPGEYGLFLYGYTGTSPLTVLGPQRARTCTLSDLTAVVGEGDGAGGQVMTPITIHNSGIVGDCTIPRSVRVRFSTADGPVDAVGPGGTFFGDLDPLPNDLVLAGGTAGLIVADTSGCLTTPTTPRIGTVIAVLDLPDGSELRLGSFEALCVLSYTHIGLAPSPTSAPPDPAGLLSADDLNAIAGSDEGHLILPTALPRWTDVVYQANFIVGPPILEVQSATESLFLTVAAAGSAARRLDPAASTRLWSIGDVDLIAALPGACGPSAGVPHAMTVQVVVAGEVEAEIDLDTGGPCDGLAADVAGDVVEVLSGLVRCDIGGGEPIRNCGAPLAPTAEERDAAIAQLSGGLGQ